MSGLRVTTPMLASVVDGLRGVIALASDEERKEHWFRYAEMTLAQLQDELDTRGDRRECPRFEAPDRIVFECNLTDGRTAELTYEVTCWAGTKPEPEVGWIGGPEIDHCTLVRVVVDGIGVPTDAWAVLVPKEADALADETSCMFEDDIIECYRRSAA